VICDTTHPTEQRFVLHRVVALEVLAPGPRSTEEGRERLRREARTAAQLAHPNIVPVQAFGETARLSYIVMQYVDGESLGDRLDREGRLGAGEVRRIMTRLLPCARHRAR
jgi:eukaryotic-like serine/threonine-protein kinase